MRHPEKNEAGISSKIDKDQKLLPVDVKSVIREALHEVYSGITLVRVICITATTGDVCRSGE
jgi:hypothetical protein